jgi:hypothetical protein
MLATCGLMSERPIPAANSWRTPPSRPRASARKRWVPLADKLDRGRFAIRSVRRADAITALEREIDQLGVVVKQAAQVRAVAQAQVAVRW